MSTGQAQLCFRDALQYIDPQTDPVNYNFAQGLLALAESLAQLESDVQAIKSAVERLGQQ